MNSISNIGGWALIKLIEVRLFEEGKKIGLFEVTCGYCKNKRTSIAIPQGKTVLIKCPCCGYAGEIHISNLENVKAKYKSRVNVDTLEADITTDSARIVAEDVRVKSQQATIHMHGPVHFVGRPFDPKTSYVIVEAEFMPDSPQDNSTQQEILGLLDRVTSLEKRVNDHLKAI